jgi:3',5'-cyclic AMP phosphodiesterase CpdA
MRSFYFTMCILGGVLPLSCSLFRPGAAVSETPDAVGTGNYAGGKIPTLEIPDDALSFIAIGDWGRNGEFHQKDVADRMGEAAGQLGAEFILALGDNFYPNGVASVHDYQFIRSFEEIYSAHSLMVDWYVVLGNHDYRGNPEAEIEYSNISRRWRMPARYYSFERALSDDSGEKALFVFIDTSPFEKKYYTDDTYKAQVGTQDTTAQKVWLERVLSQSSAKWKFVVGHHPLYSGGKRLNETGDVRSAFESVFERHRVDAYFAGHEHDLQHNVARTVHHFISGAGSEIRPTGQAAFTRFGKSAHGFLCASLTANQLLIQMVDYRGNILYKTLIEK